MARRAKSKIEKEMEKRKMDKQPTLLEMFHENPESFCITEEASAEKKARQIIKDTVKDVKKIIRKDNKKYYESMTVPGFNYVIQIEPQDTGIVYFALRGIK